MNRFRRQLVFGLLALLVATLGAWRLNNKFHGLPNYSFFTGWVLLAAMLVLALYNVRKKLPFLPLGNSETWLQIHIYLGFFTTLLFLIHLNWRSPRSPFEILLTLLFALVSGSGILGLLLSRDLAKRLATRGGEVLFEKIPGLRHGLKTEAEQLSVGANSTSPIIAEFYTSQLASFFAAPRNFWLHLAESRRPGGALLAELEDLLRFSTEADSKTIEKLATLVRQKNGLDYHRSLQLALRLWLFVHIPLTYGLMIFVVLHIVLVFGFSGGAR